MKSFFLILLLLIPLNGYANKPSEFSSSEVMLKEWEAIKANYAHHHDLSKFTVEMNNMISGSYMEEQYKIKEKIVPSILTDYLNLTENIDLNCMPDASTKFFALRSMHSSLITSNSQNYNKEDIKKILSLACRILELVNEFKIANYKLKMNSNKQDYENMTGKALENERHNRFLSDLVQRDFPSVPEFLTNNLYGLLRVYMRRFPDSVDEFEKVLIDKGFDPKDVREGWTGAAEFKKELAKISIDGEIFLKVVDEGKQRIVSQSVND